MPSGVVGAADEADDEVPGHEPLDEVTQLFLAGGPGALRAVYDAYARLVFTFCRRAVGPERAADVTQEVFTDVWRNRERFDPAQGTLRGWVMGIARYKVLGALRHDGTRPALALRADEQEPVAAGARGDGAIDLLADRLTLAQALGALPERPRKVIQLAYVDGLSHREISERTGLPLGSVKSDIRRGLVRLRADLGERS